MEKSEIIEREEIYNGKIIHVVRDKVKLPNKKIAYREVVLHNGAAAIVPLDNENNVLLVEQYRHAAGIVTLEIPAGKLEKDEQPLLCAQRELEEETGYKSNNLKLLFNSYSSVGFSNEKIAIYLAKNLQRGTQNLDEDEFINIKRIPIKKAVDMIQSGEIVDSKSIAGIMTVYSQLLLTK